jgi:hypothetical protein
VTILGHAPGWSICKIGKNSPKRKPETITLLLGAISEYWRYAEADEADPIEEWMKTGSLIPNF